jgi:hypothetical protein
MASGLWGLLITEILFRDFGIDLWGAVDALLDPGEQRLIWQLRLAFGSAGALLMLMAHVSMLKLRSLL